MNIGIAGSLESNDALVTVKAADTTKIEIHSIVDVFYHDQIEKVVKDVLSKKKNDKIHVIIEDKGALDYTIKARLLTALARMEANNA
ncbi:MAG: citrate lyase acyl carrier protein [Bacilli bacterium]|nr:citrate lyase acyl carrier protein [Bacilli bacterium]MBN2695913.1 citrate lyase acyl carrier protein [Bacilli bacterium]